MSKMFLDATEIMEILGVSFWTKDEYLTFAAEVMDKPIYYYAFELLYWCGIRLGELLALTPADFDFDKAVVSITKSYQNIKGLDVVTSPKTANSNRRVKMPQFLCDEMLDCPKMFYSITPSERIFQELSKSKMAREMRRVCKITGVKVIRIHDLRHSHVSLLINEGFSALEIGSRVGHKAEKITYRYAYLFPDKQDKLAAFLDTERMLEDSKKED